MVHGGVFLWHGKEIRLRLASEGEWVLNGIPVLCAAEAIYVLTAENHR